MGQYCVTKAVLLLGYSHQMPVLIDAPLTPASDTRLQRPWREQSKTVAAAVAMISVPLNCPGLVVPPGSQDTHGIMLIKRSKHLRGHSGQWALPGGKQEKHESLWSTAKRELHEETQLDANHVRWFGDLGYLLTGTGYRAQVYLGHLDLPRPLNADGGEAVELAAYPMSWLLRSDTWRHRTVDVIQGRHFSWGHPDPALDWKTPLWGATAFMMLALRQRLAPQMPLPDFQPKQHA